MNLCCVGGVLLTLKPNLGDTQVRDYSFDYAELLLSWNSSFPLIELALSFHGTRPFPRLNSSIPLILLKCRALNVFIASPRYRNAEPSLFR